MAHVCMDMMFRSPMLHAAGKADHGFLTALVTTLTPVTFMRNEALSAPALEGPNTCVHCWDWHSTLCSGVPNALLPV